MNTLFGQEKLPLIIIHGGASPIDPKGNALTQAITSIENMASICMNNLKSGKSAIKLFMPLTRAVPRPSLCQSKSSGASTPCVAKNDAKRASGDLRIKPLNEAMNCAFAI